MAQPLFVDDGLSGVILAFLLILTLVLPVHQAWDAFSSMGWHPVFRLLVCGGGVLAIFYALHLMYRHLPAFISIGLTVTYVSAVYWWAAMRFGADPIWCAAIALAAGLIGFFGARSLSRYTSRAPA